MTNYVITFYDLEYNIIRQFDSYKECAEYFNTTTKAIQSYICKSKKGIVKKKRNIEGKTCGYLVKDNIDE